MPELFETIPPNLFRPLAAPGATVYARALFTLFVETRRHQQPLSRDLPLVIYLRSYGDGSLGYEIEELTDAEWIERDDVGFRDFVLRRTPDQRRERH